MSYNNNGYNNYNNNNNNTDESTHIIGNGAYSNNAKQNQSTDIEYPGAYQGNQYQPNPYINQGQSKSSTPWTAIIGFGILICALTFGATWYFMNRGKKESNSSYYSRTATTGRDLTADNRSKELKESQQKIVAAPALRRDNPYSWLSEDYITFTDLSPYTRNELKILRNAIFARHGYIFNSKELTDHFSQFSWYTPRYTNVTRSLTDIERENIRMIEEAESDYYN